MDLLELTLTNVGEYIIVTDPLVVGLFMMQSFLSGEIVTTLEKIS